MEKRIIPIALLVLSLCSMLLFADNLQSAYALTVDSFILSTSAATEGYGYYSPSDYVLGYDTEGCSGIDCVIELASASDGTIINTYTNILAKGGGITDANIFACSTTIAYCFFMGTFSGSDVRIQAIRLTSPFTVTTYNNGTTYSNCDNGGGVVSGNTVILSVKGCTNASFNGIWTINIEYLLDGISGNNDQIITAVANVASQPHYLCYDSPTNSYYVIDNSNNIYKLNPSTFAVTTTLATGLTGGSANYMTCDNEGHAIISGSNTIKVVTLSSMTLSAETTSTNVYQVLRHAESIYATTTASTSLTVFEFDATNAMTNVGTVAGLATSSMLIKANATRFNAINNVGGGGADMILYAVGDLSNDGGEQPAEPSNQVDGVCGNGTALECVGDRGTLGNIFYGTGGTSQPITNVTNNLLNGLGITNTTNTDIKTNGTGLFLMLLTGVFFFVASIASVAVANSKFNANIQYSDSAMNAYWLLFLVIAVVAISYYLAWIPDIIFYGLVIGLAGLFAFGAYRHFKSGG